MLPPTVQIVLFSATFPDQVVRYANKFAPSANQITLRHQDLTIEGIRQLSIDVHKEEAKYDVLVALYGLMSIGSSVIFVRVNAVFDLGLFLLISFRHATRRQSSSVDFLRKVTKFPYSQVLSKETSATLSLMPSVRVDQRY